MPKDQDLETIAPDDLIAACEAWLAANRELVTVD